MLTIEDHFIRYVSFLEMQTGFLDVIMPKMARTILKL